ncbi:MAG: DMT family transporter [Deltaproteobacteria bacterium]|jgi:drug/metabolite transporter (DMT)-like permease|nr:DMT family transporter [Deltaproteobacteria bacterium]
MKPWQADLAIVGAAAIWGMSFIFTRWGLTDCSPALFLVARFGLALAVSLLLFGGKLAGMPRATLRRGFILGVLMGGGYLLQTYSVNFTEVSRAAFIAALTLPAIPVMSFILFRQKLRLNNAVGIALALLGLYLLLDPRFSGFRIGDLMALVSVPLWALYLIYINIFTEGIDEPHLTARLLLTQFLGALALVAVFTLIFESGFILPPLHPDLGKGLKPTGLFWAGLTYCALLASIGIVFIQTSCQKYTTAVQAMLCFQLEPVTATAGAFLLLGEQVGLKAVIGAAVIILGVLASELGGMLGSKKA